MNKTIYRRFCAFALTFALILSLGNPARAAESGGAQTETGDNSGGQSETETGDSGGETSVSLTLSQTAITVEPGANAALTATPSAEIESAAVQWTIVNKNVVEEANKDGFTLNLKAVSAGETDVMAQVGEGDPVVCKVTVSGFVITPDTLEIDESDSVPLGVVAYGRASADAALTWNSDNTEIVAIDTADDGAVSARGVSVGSARVTCMGGGYGASRDATVKVKEEEIFEVKLASDSLIISPGKTAALEATTTANGDDIKWRIANENVAKVQSQSGYTVTIEGVAKGETVLSAQVGNGPVSRCAISVSGIAFSSDSVSVMETRSLELSLLTYGDARDVPLSTWEWTSNNLAVATVTPSSSGAVVRGITPGNARISVIVGEYTTSCLVTVTKNDYAVTVTLSEATITMAPGSSSRLRANTIADSADIAWTIGDETITQIASKTGYTVILTAGEPGQTMITATVGASEPASCTVIVSGVTLSKNTMSMVVNGRDAITLTTYGEAQNVPASNWEWSSSNTGVAIVSKTTSGAEVRAVGAGNSTITCTGGGYTVICQVEVAANEASALKASLSGGVLKFSDLLADLKNICKTMTSEELSYITTVSVNTSLGTLYDGYVSEGDTGFGVATNRNYYAANGAYLISNITFVPKADVNGDVKITYDGFTVNNKTFTGSIIVSVSQSQATLAYASLNAAPIRFRAEDFFNYSMAVNNRSLQYLTFTLPSSRYGVLYYNYVNDSVYESVVTGGTRYYRTYNPAISNVTFVPNPAYSGNFSLLFTGYDTEGVSFAGIARISVNNPNGSDTTVQLRERLHYETGPSARVYFDTQDFVDECREQTGYQLVSIFFRSLPDTDHGRVYYGRDTRAYAGTDYYVSGSGELISNLNFVAHKDYRGTFTIPFRGKTAQDTTFTGEIQMTVSANGAYLIFMSATGGMRSYLSATDFSDVSKAAHNREFHHVSFPELPSTGKLYYENGSTPVAANAFYYRSGSDPLLSSVNYIPPDTFSGEVRIPCAVWDTSGESFTAHLSFLVTPQGIPNANANASAYSTSGPAISLRAADILGPAQTEIRDVVSVHLTPPDPSVGKLVLNYLSPGIYSPFNSARDYAPDDIPQIFFLPKAGFSGTASVTYVARNRYNTVYSGILRLNVNPPTNSAYFIDLANRSWAVPAVDFFRYYNILQGTTPNTYEPDGPARRGAFIAVMGRMYGFPQTAGNGGYEDVAENFYYTPYIATARALGVTEAAQYFYPDAAISRQDAAVYLYRCLVRAGQAPNASVSNLSRFKDGYLVAYYAMEAMSALVELGVYQGDENGYLNPASTLTRLQMAAILYRAVT